MKKLIALLLALVMVIGITACGAKNEPTAEVPATEEPATETPAVEEPTAEGEYKYKVAFCTISQANDTMVNQAENMKAYGRRHGVEVVVFDNKADAQQVLQNAEIICRDGTFDAVLNFNVDSNIAATLMDLYNEAGLPVISIDVEHPGSAFFGADNEKCGQLCGQFVTEYATENWGGTIDRLVIFDQLMAGELPRQRVLGAIPVIADGLGIENIDDITYSFDNNADSAKAQTDFASYLQSNPDAEKIAVVCLNEDMAMGCQAAAATAGREDQVVCVTNNEDFTISQWEKETAETCVKACISFTFTHYGKWLIPAVVELLETGECADYTYVDHQIITRENMAEYRAEYPSRIE